MTRRIRFTPLLRAGVFLALAGTASAADVPFTPQPPVASGVGFPRHPAAGDVDGDGDQDLAVAQYGDDAVGWYENDTGDGTLWTRHTVATGVSGATHVHLADVDADGDTDVLAAAYDGDAITWYENDVGDGSAWTAHLVATATVALSVATADVDGDGDLDVLSAYGLAWHENTTGDGGAWVTHTVSTTSNSAAKVAAADFDRDGDQDILAGAAGGGNRTTWYENTGGGTGWTAHEIHSDGSSWAGAADVDRDGDHDVISTDGFGRVSWYENSGGGSGWAAHTIATAVFSFSQHAAAVADIDADGDLDVLALAGSAAFPLQWFENADGVGSAWTPRTIQENSELAGVAAADLDGDGDPDLVFADPDTGTVQRFRNDTIHSTGCFAPAAAVFTQAPGAYSVAAADLDGDGDLDPASASYADNAIRWYPNVDHAASFLVRTISTAAAVPTAVRPADVDGDGDPDVLASALGPPGLVAWHENLPGDGWTLRTIATESSVLAVHPADLDGDGDVDVLSAARLSDTIAWNDNTGGDGLTWTRRTITTSLDDVLAVSAADLDRDGDLDVIGAGVAGTVAWFENTAGDGSAWTRRTIATNASGGAAVAAADLDGDGDLDVLSASYYDDKVAWYENTAGNGTAWTTRTISTAGDGTQTVAAADVDGDGDLDVLSSSIYDDTVAWHENAAGNGTVWTRRIVSNGVDWAAAIATTDLDGDGDTDLLSAGRNAGSVFWHANGRGQFALAASSAAPPGAVNGAQVPMLRVFATHLGRIGDGDVELTQLGVRVEEAPGDPYTTAEANAVIEALRVYRDANGNGVFDLGTDVQVTIVDQLALTGGAQAIAFADGDPGVQIPAGPSRTYFVIAELTADASTHAPNNFRLVHLGVGPFAGAAEDRAHDIPLRPACPTDAPSTVVVPITPVELSGFGVE